MKKSNTADMEAMLAEIPDDRRTMAADILEELQFTKRLLKKLKRVIDERGVAELYPKGRALVLRESPAVRSYNQALQKFSLLYRQLENLLPKSVSNNSNELLDFIQAQNEASK